MEQTPPDWRHVRLCETDEDCFAIRTFYTRGRLGPLALIALGFDRETKTDDLSRADALTLGGKLEAAMIRINDFRPTKRRRD